MELDLSLEAEVRQMPIEDFLSHCEHIEPEDRKRLIRLRARHDLEFFASVFFPHYCKYDFNEFHRDVFTRFGQDRVEQRTVDCAPRGYAKSTIHALIKPVHDVCYGLENYILIVSATDRQSDQIIKNIRAELLNNRRLADVFGIAFDRKNPATTQFVVYSGDGEDKHRTMFQAVGAGAEIRGLRFEEHRPSKIVLDDVEDSTEVQNPELRQKVRDWFFEVIRQLGSNETKIEAVGTVLHRDSLLKNLEKNPGYKTKIYKAVISWSENEKLWQEWQKIYTNLDDPERELKADAFYKSNQVAMLQGAKVLWPEKEPYHFLMKEMVEVGKRAFMKEKQNSPMTSEESLFDNIWWYHEDASKGGYVVERTGGVIPYDDLLAYGVIDPATGDTKTKMAKKGLDFTCILSGYHDPKGRLLVHKDWTKKEKPSNYIKAIFEHHEEMKFEKFAVEMNLYRNLLMENLVRERKEREAERRKRGEKAWGVRIPFYEVENSEKKEKRIFTLEPKVNHGWILFNRALSLEFMNQIDDFPKGDHDDGPDALEMLWGLVNNRYPVSPISVDAMGVRG